MSITKRLAAASLFEFGEKSVDKLPQMNYNNGRK